LTLNEKSFRRDQMLVSLSVSCVPTDKPQLGGPIPGFGLVHARVGKEPAEGVGVGGVERRGATRLELRGLLHMRMLPMPAT
jgi:hypothetical protein